MLDALEEGAAAGGALSRGRSRHPQTASHAPHAKRPRLRATLASIPPLEGRVKPAAAACACIALKMRCAHRVCSSGTVDSSLAGEGCKHMVA